MKVSTKTLVVYFVVFYAAWAVCTLWLMPIVDLIPNEYVATFLKNGVLKSLVWALPSATLIARHRDGVEVSLRGMFTERVNWLEYLPILVLFAVYVLVGAYTRDGSVSVSPEFRYSDLIVVLFVGVTEELVFRGWLLNATIKGKQGDDLYVPIGVNALLFLTVHFPRWVADGVLVSNFTSLAFVSILVLSGIFSYTFVKSRSLWVPIVLHSFWDLMVFVYVG